MILALRKTSKATEEHGFRRITGIGGVTLFVLEREGQRINLSETRLLFDRNGLRPLNYREALWLFSEDDRLRGPLKGYSFHVSGEEPERIGICEIKRGGKLDRQNGETNLEKRVLVWKGGKGHPLGFAVCEDLFAREAQRRFQLDTSILEFSAVVGVREGQRIEELIRE